MLRIGLCDDEAPEREKLYTLIENYAKQKHLSANICCFQSGEDLLWTISKGQNFDVIFLDVYMGITNGVNIARDIREFDKTCCIIFATNSKEHAIDGYGVHALQYLLKPISEESVMAVLERAMEILMQNKDLYVQLSNRQGSYKILFNEIIYVESNARVITIHTKNQGVLSFYGRLDNFELQCNDRRFFRCHKSYIVNLDYVYAVANHSIQLETRQEIPVSIKISIAKDIFASYTARNI